MNYLDLAQEEAKNNQEACQRDKKKCQARALFCLRGQPLCLTHAVGLLNEWLAIECHSCKGFGYGDECPTCHGRRTKEDGRWKPDYCNWNGCSVENPGIVTCSTCKGWGELEGGVRV